MAVKYTQCPRCASSGADTSKDNLAVFPEGHKHCFACGYHVPAQVNGGSEDIANTKPVKLPSSCTADTIPNHGCVSKATLKKFGVRYPLRQTISKVEIADKKVLLFPYFTMVGDDAVLTGVKRRDYSKPKKAGISWCAGVAGIFGLSVRTGSRTLIVCEGEPDTMAMFEHSGFQTDVWGIQGASSTKHLKRVGHLLEYYDNILLCFDPDNAGQEATESALEYLPEYKVRVVTLPADVCDTIESGKHLKPYIKKAKKVGYSQNIYGADLTKAYLSHLSEASFRGFDTGYDGLNSMLGGELKRTEVLMLSAHTGTGKSTLTLNIAYNIARFNDTRVMWVTTEMMYLQMVHKAVELDLGREIETVEGRIDTSIEDIADSLSFVSDKFVFYTGEMDLTSIEAAVHEAVAVNDIGVLIIDVLNDIDADITDWKQARTIMARINSLAQGSPKDKRPPIAVILVAHTKLRDGKYSNDISLSDIAGGSTLVRQCTCIIAMNGEIGKRRRYLKTVKLPRMGSARKTETELVYNIKHKFYEEAGL